MTRAHVSCNPEQSPAQPSNRLPGAGLAVSTTVSPCVIATLQLEVHETLGALDAIAPAAGPALES